MAISASRCCEGGGQGQPLGDINTFLLENNNTFDAITVLY